MVVDVVLIGGGDWLAAVAAFDSVESMLVVEPC